MSLVRDCTWRRLTSICVRNLSGNLSELTLEVNSSSGDLVLQLPHFASSHPSWEQLEIPFLAFPATFRILNADSVSIFESTINLEYMYYITSSFEEIDDFSFLACLFEIDNEIYTNSTYFQDLEKVSINSSNQIKYKVLQTIQPKKVNYPDIQAKYLQLLNLRNRYLHLQISTNRSKTSIQQLIAKLSTCYEQDKQINSLQDSSDTLKETIAQLKNKIEESKTLCENLNEKICFAKKVLGAHDKKYRERIEQAQTELLSELDLKTRILTTRRTFMIQKVSFIFNECAVLSGYLNLISKNYAYDEEISTALGYLNLLIQIIYDINGVYLPYPSYFCGSRSLIYRDSITLPLYNTSKNIDTKVLQAIEITFSNIQQILNSYKNTRILSNSTSGDSMETDILRFLNIRLG